MKWKADKSLDKTSSKGKKMARRRRMARKIKNDRFLEGFVPRAHEEQEAGNICESDYNGYGYIARHFSTGKVFRDHVED